jgi:MoxR-like ATPase
MGMLFAWATPEYLLDRMSIEQVISYYNEGWKAKQTEARVCGLLMSSGEDEQVSQALELDEVKRYYPDAHYENDKIVHS